MSTSLGGIHRKIFGVPEHYNLFFYSITMFFASEIAFPFETMRDVLKALPSWTLLIHDGNQIIFETPESQVRHNVPFSLRHSKLAPKVLKFFNHSGIKLYQVQ